MPNQKNIKYYFPYQKISENLEVPKAPIVYLRMQEVLEPFRETIKYPAIIDTGADATLIPITMLLNLNLQTLDIDPSNRPRSLEEQIIAYTQHRIKLSFNDQIFYGTKIWALVGTINQDLIIIGRDFLNNRFTVTFNGKELVTIIQPLK